MPIITKIESQVKRAGRVNVYLDDEFAFGLAEKLVVDFDLHKGRELSPAEVDQIKDAEGINKCLDKAYHFLSFRPRSEKEMRDKLLEKFEPDTVEAVIEKLKSYNYINDADFARMWVNSRSQGRSAKALSFELQRKGLDKQTIEEAISEINKESEFKSALELVQGKPKYQGLDKNKAYQKVGGFLARRGYNYDIIKQVIKEVYPD